MTYTRRSFAKAALAAVAAPAPATTAPADTFNYVIGTQAIGATYQFTPEPLVVETARAILAMGSNLIKFTIGRGYERMMLRSTRSAYLETVHYLLNQGADSAVKPPWPVPGVAPGVRPEDPRIRTLTDAAALSPAYREVLAMPFAYNLIWTYSFTSGWWLDGFPAASRRREYDEMRAFVSYLLRTYNGSGKTFLLGHWEGDWHLRPWQLPWFAASHPNAKVTSKNIDGMIAWLATRQQAVDDARRSTPHHNVSVYHYTEANLVHEAIAGKPSVAATVLPHVKVDYVSYSAYDSLGDIANRLPKALDFLQSRHPRVFIGEYGFPARTYPEAERDRRSREVIRIGFEHACPFILCWEMYNNEYNNGAENGYWLIDNKRTRQPLWHTHHDFYRRARRYVAAARPTPGDFARFGARQFS